MSNKNKELPDINGWELVKLLIKYYDYYFKGQKGSHVKIENKKTGTILIIPCRKGKSLKKGTLKGILRDADISVPDIKSKM